MFITYQEKCSFKWNYIFMFANWFGFNNNTWETHYFSPILMYLPMRSNRRFQLRNYNLPRHISLQYPASKLYGPLLGYYWSKIIMSEYYWTDNGPFSYVSWVNSGLIALILGLFPSNLVVCPGNWLKALSFDIFGP